MPAYDAECRVFLHTIYPSLLADLYPFGVDKKWAVCLDIFAGIYIKKQKREAFRGLSVPTNEGGDDPILKKRLEKKKYVHWAI
jgi:hypothetical protein